MRGDGGRGRGRERVVRVVDEGPVLGLRVVEGAEGVLEAVARSRALERGVGEVLEEGADVEEDDARGVGAHGDAEHRGRFEAEHPVAYEVHEVVLLELREHAPAEREPGRVSLLEARGRQRREAHDALGAPVCDGVHAPERVLAGKVRLELGEVGGGHGVACVCVYMLQARMRHVGV